MFLLKKTLIAFFITKDLRHKIKEIHSLVLNLTS